MRLNIRCCCLPVKILGTLEVPPVGVERREFFVPLLNSWHKIETARIELRVFRQLDRANHDWQEELAVYSEDRPLEFWRRVPGFIEAKT